MSNVTYLVFENSTNVLDMNKINVFRNGSEMPWTYYQADVNSDTNETRESEGRNRLMFTSESKPGPNGEKAGKYVSQIKRYVRYGNGQKFQEQVINNPTVADYKSWGWKLASDPITGEEKLPEYGEFAFKPGMEPNYEILSSFTPTFKFGFGLNNTCYNFAEEQVTIQVYNLSCKPKVFCTNNAFCEIKFDPATGSYGPDLTPQNDDDTITCTTTEGTPNSLTGKGYAYIMTCIEAGETLDVSFINYGSDLSKNQLELTVEQSDAVDKVYNEESTSGGFRLSKIYRNNVSGDGSLNVTGGLKFDFLRLKVSAQSGYRNLKYNDEKLCVNLKLTPVANNQRLDSFATYITVFLELTKDTGSSSIPGIRAATVASEGFYMNNPADIPAQNRRARLVVTAKEAINYAIKNNEGPSFINGKTADEAFKFYQRSMLTETEKNIDDYKKSFDSDEMIRKLAHFMVTDLSGTKTVTKNLFATGITQGQVAKILNTTEVKNMWNLLKSDLGEEPCTSNMPLSKIYEKASRAEKFQALVDKIKNTTKDIDDNGTDSMTNTELNYLRPWADASSNTKRKINSIHTSNADGETQTLQTQLLSNNTTLLAILYAINEYKITGSNSLINKYINRINEDRSSQSTGQSNILTELYGAMHKEYHGDDKESSNPNDSINRPEGLFEQLYQYRCKLNPVEGISGRRYINEIVEIKDVSGTDTFYYGTDELYRKHNLAPVRARKTEIEQLLYNGNLKSSIGKNKLINNNYFGEGLSLTGLLFQSATRDNVNGAVFYTDNDNSDGTNLEGQFRGSDVHQFSKTLRANPTDISNTSLAGKWVLSTTGTMAQAYAEGNWHPENCDLSGVIKIPDAGNGCYWDIFIDGQEVKETVVDLEEIYDPITTNATGGGHANTAYDLSNLRDYYVDDENASRHYTNQANVKNIMLPDSLSEEFKKQYRYTNVGIYSFFRIGETIKFLANLEDLDAETLPAMKFPEIKIRERNDKTGLCQTIISDAYVPLKDVESELSMTIEHLGKDYGEGYDLSGGTNDFRSAWYWQDGSSNAAWDADTSGVYTSRWGTLCIPLVIYGQLERGEEFQLSTENDKWMGNNSYTDDVSAGYRDFIPFDSIYGSDLSHQIPENITDCGFKIEYQNLGDNAWTCADDVTFTYECHNKSKNVNNTTAYTSDGAVTTSLTSSGGNKMISSNIKGMPRFRVCLQPQSKLLQYYLTTTSDNVVNQTYNSLGRQVNVNLKYNKSAKKNTNGTVDIDGNNKSVKVRVIVDNDNYSANIDTQELTYNSSGKQTKGEVKVIREIKQGTTYSTGYAFGAADSVVGPGVKEGPNSQQQCVPDYTRQQVYNIQSTYYTGLGVQDGERSIDFREVEFRENMNGVSKPLVTIGASNFKLSNGNYSCTAEIAPIFKFEKDEIDFASSGTYCNIANNTTPGSFDATEDAPRLIPANTNYGIYATDNNTKFHLYRINNLNYEEWVGGTGDIYTYNNFFNSTNNKPFREIVNVKLTYFSPNDNGSVQSENVLQNPGIRHEQQIVFLVEPKDTKELHYPENFHFTVNEGDKSVDITSILSATLEGKSSSDMEYLVVGAIDESGEVHIHNDIASESAITGFAATADASSISYTYSGSDTPSNLAGLTFNTSAYNSNGSDDIAHTGKVTEKINKKLVNGKLMLYHKNHTVSNTNNINQHFDAYEKRDYRFLVLAKYGGNNQQGTEQALTLVTITVQPGSTGFYLAEGKKWYHNVTETLGSIAEGKGLLGNNPDIPLSTFTSNLRHEDLTGDLHLNKNVTWRIAELDEDLMVSTSVSANADFSNQVIRLKDIDSNKTTETAVSESTQLAPYNHYNYERKTEYKVTLEVCLSNYHEICVEKVTNYICGFGETNDDAWSARIGADQAKTTTYLMKEEDNSPLFSASKGPDHTDHNGKLYYFKDPETGLYQGPLSAVPTTMSQLDQKTKVHGVSVRDAYVRYNKAETSASSEGGYQPLYKTSEFRTNHVKPPKPDDNCLQPFTINVIDSYDKAKVSPQPYMIKEKSQAYCTADPVHQEILDNDLITTHTNLDGSTIAYVYADHKEFQNRYTIPSKGTEKNYDLPNDFKIPSWHPSYVVGASNSTTPVERVIHPDAFMSNKNTFYNNGRLNGTSDGSANFSRRYGCFSEDQSGDTVILDYFIEYHDKIDMSGENEVANVSYNAVESVPFGNYNYDYKNTLPINYKKLDGTTTDITNSVTRLVRANNICRNRKHKDSNTANKYYATAEIDINAAAQIGRTYQFTVVAVSNVLASKNDMNYNKNMVDWNESFYPYIKMDAEGNTSSDKYPQPFQKYIYDSTCERITHRSLARQPFTYSIDESGAIFTPEHYGIPLAVDGIPNRTDLSDVSGVAATDSYAAVDNKGISMVIGDVSDGCARAATVKSTSAGSGYSVDDICLQGSTSGGTGSGLVIKVREVSSGAITKFSIEETGKGYVAGEEVTVTNGNSDAVIVISTVANGVPQSVTFNLLNANRYADNDVLQFQNVGGGVRTTVSVNPSSGTTIRVNGVSGSGGKYSEAAENVNYLQSSGSLLCCRTHFTVCVTEGGSGSSTVITAKTGNYEARTTVDSAEANLKFDGGITNGVLNADGTVTSSEKVNALNGDIRLFSVGNGQVIMAQFMNKVWTSLNH